MKICAHTVVFMPIVHIYFAHSIFSLELEMSNCIAMYQNIVNASPGLSAKTEVEEIAKNYLKAKRRHNRIRCIFQEIRLFEIVGESGPQATAQICFALRTGYQGPFQIFSIFMSLLSLASGASETILLYPTVENKKEKTSKKEVSWKQTWLIFVPLMFLVSSPRLLCLGLELAYLHKWYMWMPFVTTLCLISITIN